jgi:tRNA A37 methylthiotransferase MiaB
VVDVLVEEIEGSVAEGRADHQGPEVDGTTTVPDAPAGTGIGDIVRARVTGTDGVDLIAVMAGATR